MTYSARPDTSRLCLILAKKNSRRIPEKNKRPLHGRPLYAYTIDAAVTSGIFTHIVCSSDDDAILNSLSQWPEVRGDRRPKHLADNTASAWDVLRDFLTTHENTARSIEDICILTPCHPFRSAVHISDAFREYRQAQADALLSVTPYPYPPELAFGRDSRGRLSRQWQGLNRKEDHPVRYYPNGAVLFVRREHFAQQGNIYGGNCYGYILDWPYGLDIDTWQDLEMAERLFHSYRHNVQENGLCPA